MNSNLEKNWNVHQEVYERSNRGTILEPKSLWTKKQPTWHQASLVGVGVKREVWIRGPQWHPSSSEGN